MPTHGLLKCNVEPIWSRGKIHISERAFEYPPCSVRKTDKIWHNGDYKN